MGMRPMSKRIFDLQGVLPDEAEDIRHLLQRNRIRFFETPGGTISEEQRSGLAVRPTT